MPYSPPEGERWTETLVEAALEACWAESPRSPEGALFLSNAYNLLNVQPYRDERQALHWRGFAKARMIELPVVLAANNCARQTYEDRWRRGIKILTRLLNQECDIIYKQNRLDARKRRA